MENKNLRTIISQRPTYDLNPKENLIYDIEFALSRVIDKEIEFYKKLDSFKYELANNQDFSVKDAFEEIDFFNTSYIDYENLIKFLENNGFHLYEEQIVAILRRIDKDDDGRINFNEFQEEILPVEKIIRNPHSFKYNQSPTKYSYHDSKNTSYKNLENR